MKKKLGQTGRAGEQGFSLIELLIAMVITLLVCGAVVSLLMQGNRSFQIQPDMTERQQNIRASMDMIMRDVANAGAGLPMAGMQVFTRGLHATARYKAPDGTQSDELEMLSNDSGQDPVPACQNGGVNVRIVPTKATFTDQTTVMLLMTDGTYSLRTITSSDKGDNSGAGGCDAGIDRPRLMFNKGLDTTLRNPGGTVCGPDNFGMGTSSSSCTVQSVVYMDVIRYYIDKDPNDAAMPVLHRVSSAGDQIVAQGIEDMKVTYRAGSDITAHPTATPETFTADNQPADTTGATSAAAQANMTTIEVQVVLSARGTQLVTTAAARKAVMTNAADGSFAYRGSLVSRGTPRAALAALADGRWR
jgi:prepilin-type N-terminal cleavage/methylation domain-containing protein